MVIVKKREITMSEEKVSNIIVTCLFFKSKENRCQNFHKHCQMLTD